MVARCRSSVATVRSSATAGHSYDIARSGYVNLLQPQDRRSPRGRGLEGGDRSARGAARRAASAARSSTRSRRERPRSIWVTRQSSSISAAVRVKGSRRSTGCAPARASASISRLRPPSARRGVSRSDLGRRQCRPSLCRCSTRASISWCRFTAGAILPRRRACSQPGRCLLIAVPAADDLIELRELVQGAARRARSRRGGARRARAAVRVDRAIGDS